MGALSVLPEREENPWVVQFYIQDEPLGDVIEQFPVSEHVNQAYYYIGLGHFQLGHYSRAITALEKVGTALSDTDSRLQKVEAGKKLRR